MSEQDKKKTQEEEIKDLKEKLAEERTAYAEVRTALAKKRTIQACLRTGLAFTGAGIVILKFAKLGNLGLLIGGFLISIGLWMVIYYTWWGQKFTKITDKVESEVEEKTGGEIIANGNHKPRVVKKIKQPIKRIHKLRETKNKNEILPYDENFPEMFERVKSRIKKQVKNSEVHHIGSTAVPGLAGKGIIDVMVALDSWENEGEVIKKLKGLGYTHVHPKEEGRVFMQKEKFTEKGDVHIHIVKKGNKEYKEKLGFRDYLRGNKAARERYENVKRESNRIAKKDREEYNERKSEFVEKILGRLRKQGEL